MDVHRFLNLEDKKEWVDGDLVRLLVIWTYGGAWIDMDVLITLDLSPLLKHEFVMQWDCYDNLPSLERRAHYLCELFHFMVHSTPPRSPSTDWGAILYLRLPSRSISRFKSYPSTSPTL
ncbi:hypothetical protein M405DRAFT_809600 [Rhizopogon salebrosus TDB-379]|nr:hypothetical protein M405DRAFT_809600 [Rhizopogon salebrosus TDB-379]